MPADEGSSLLDALWLDTLHRICGRAAHEVKGALNGVAVNLEVVRSRAEKPNAEASSVRQYATAAAGQLDVVITLTEALLALTRPAPEPVQVATVVKRIGALLAPVAHADGRRLEIDGSFDDTGVTSAGGSAVRLAVGGCLLGALDVSAHIRCTPSPGETPSIRIESCDGASLTADGRLVAAVASAGIRVQAESSAIIISFPR